MEMTQPHPLLNFFEFFLVGLCHILAYAMSLQFFCIYDLFLVYVVFDSFLPRIVDSLASLLQSGADREPEIIEQVQAMVSVVFFSCQFLFCFQFFLIASSISIWTFPIVAIDMQIFKSWSYIMMYLQKYLIRDLVYLLK